MANQPTQTPAPAPSSQTPKPQTSSNKTLIIVICVVVGIFMLSVIVGAILLFAVGKKVADESSELVEQSQEFVASVSSYPSTYVEAGLPQYPGAEVTNLNGDDADPKDGVVILLVTQDQVTDVATYFDAELAAKGWQLDASASQASEGLVTRSYKKANQALTVTISGSEDGTNATISWEEQ